METFFISMPSKNHRQPVRSGLLKSFRFRPLIQALVYGLISISAISCQDKLDQCALDNTGSLEVSNTRVKGSLYVFYDKSKLTLGNADLIVGPGETVDDQLPVGAHHVQAYLVISSCNGGRCSVSYGETIERDIDLSACDNSFIVY